MPVFLVISEKGVQITLKHHITPVKMAVIWNQTVNIGEDVGKEEPLACSLRLFWVICDPHRLTLQNYRINCCNCFEFLNFSCIF